MQSNANMQAHRRRLVLVVPADGLLHCDAQPTASTAESKATMKLSPIVLTSRPP